MSGKHITDQQIRLYMNLRKEGNSQLTSAAKSGISERSARRIDTGKLQSGVAKKRHWRTRKDPLEEVWSTELIPMLENAPGLLPSTLFDYLCDNYPGRYDDKILRTLQRRIKQWKALYGPDKEVMFRQTKSPGRLGISDFTSLKKSEITIGGEDFKHLLYHYRLPFSGWCYVKVTLGGESFTALSTGLQKALWRSGGVPTEHRTDSLSAAFNNKSGQEIFTRKYNDLSKHYGFKATRNNRGASHENGAIESPHGHLKRRIRQAILLRGSKDFESLEEYQCFIDTIVNKLNQRCQTRFKEERCHLKTLPKRRTNDYGEHQVLVTSSSTFQLRRVTYSVPSRFINERLYIQLFEDKLKVFLGHQFIFDLPRVYAPRGLRAQSVNYRHIIGTLVKKPQAFRFSQLRDSILPSEDYRRIWTYVDETLSAHQATRYIVRLLQLAANEDCEGPLGRYVLKQISKGILPSEYECSKLFHSESILTPRIDSHQHPLSSYDSLLTINSEVNHG